MDLKIEFYGSLCATSEFIINGIRADSNDFGSQGDEDSENAQDYGCGDMTFTPLSPSNEIMSKYNITELEFNDIAEKLKEGLSFGQCGWCV